MNVFVALGLGLVAGAVGTAVMTISETLEMRMTRRQPSTVPGQVGAKLLRRHDPEAPEKLNGAVHWTHGITMGAVRGLLGLTPLGPIVATAVHYLIVWSGDVMLYRSLGIAEWPWQWKRTELITDLFHKGIYAIATGITFELLVGLV